MRYTLLFILAIGCGVQAWAQGAARQPRVLTLEECRQLALQHNVALKNAANSEAAAKQDEREAFTRFFPTVSATGMGFNANKELMQMEMAPGQSMAMLKNGITGSITLSQPVFAGGQIWNGHRLARKGVEAGKLQRMQTEDEVRQTVEQYFWQVVELQEKRKTLDATERMLERLCKDVKAAVDAGVKTRNDLLSVQLRQGEVEGSRVELVHGIAVSKMVLAQYIGMDSESIAVSADVPVGEVPPFPSELLVDHHTALAATTGYKLLQTQVDISKLQQKMAVGKNMPSLAVGASCMYDDLMGHSHRSAVGFVSLSVPLSAWWGGSHAVKKEKLQVSNAQNTLKDRSELLVIGMQQAWHQLEDAHRQLQIARDAIGQSDENLRLNTDGYRVGTVPMSDLLEAQRLHQDSRDRYVTAYTQYRNAVLGYTIATGSNR